MFAIVGIGFALGVSYYKQWLNNKQNIALTILAGAVAGIAFNGLINYIKINKTK